MRGENLVRGELDFVGESNQGNRTHFLKICNKSITDLGLATANDFVGEVNKVRVFAKTIREQSSIRG